MPTIDYLPFATGTGANVIDQASYNGSGVQQRGFQTGEALSDWDNKPMRQATMFAAAMANFIANQLGINVLDDGNLSALITNLTDAIQANARIQTIVTVPFSATPTFDASQGSIFEMTLTGNVTGLTFANLKPGMVLTVILKQDATGSRTFAWPAGVNGANPSPTPSSTSVQRFAVDSGSNVYAASPMVVTG